MEIAKSGLKFEKLIAIEGIGWSIQNFKEKLNDSVYMEKLLKTIKITESNDDLIAMSPHTMAVARKE